MKKLFFLLSALFIITHSYSQTIVPGGAVSGNWSAGGSPYLIQGAIMIANDSTLTIEPGVRVEFQGNFMFLVMGRVLAIGNATDSITFTANNPSIGWLGFRFDNTQQNNDTSKFYYCNVLHGKNNLSYPNGHGGGFYFNNFGKAIISNSVIRNCWASFFGGAIYCYNANNIIISNNTIVNNTANGGQGGGICLEETYAIVANNFFSNNLAWVGGGIFTRDGVPLIINNTVSGNICDYDGGGICCYGGIIKNNTIVNNIAQGNNGQIGYGGGGGIACLGSNTIIVTNNIICNNISNNIGGGIYCDGADISSGEISNNIITNNLATTNFGGGGIAMVSSSIPVNNNTISNNSAERGGGMYFYSSSPRVQNNIVWGNSSVSSGNQMYIFDEPADPNFYNNDIEGGQGAFGINSNVFYLGTYSNNINADPQLNAPSAGSGNVFNGLTANWTLQQTSPCIDGGSVQNITYPATDIAGNPRLVGSTIDIGAYENIVLITNLELFGTKKGISITPNPFNNEATIQSFDKLNFSTVNIYNMFGQEVKNIKTFAGETIKIQRDDLPAGMYILKLTNHNITVATEKIIITD